ncbi:CPBP family intramembrane glutamic endopeptidase [Neobacillus sp. PS3-12]|uniref:CPBP family intramembrane glutamic endopeptidase n=1 Tax=Neobacillus sp. PS3-12 TaxID=3070677 RepID=UPI0027E08B55|nr:CPBP family intramembrane glutamic endopeptidase [Neobacillus sp. PS3-12]WML52104.1 CPBP family intramembrane glutamic endopeptidase [Neobacillus sp. PS3-12]
MSFIRSLIRPSLFMVFFLFISISLMVIDNILKLGLSSEEGINIFIVPFSLCWSWVIVHTALRKDFLKRFLLSKKNIHLAICIPILVAIVMEFVLNLVQFIPFLLGYDVIKPGINQVTTIKDFTEIGLIFSVSVISPFSEEFVFRYLLYGGLSLAIVKLAKENKLIKKIYNELFINKNQIYIWSWIILTNIGFAMAHGPNLLSFPLYFVPGIVFSIMFLRLGFLAAWISHGSSNLFSWVAHEIIVNTLFK